MSRLHRGAGFSLPLGGLLLALLALVACGGDRPLASIVFTAGDGSQAELKVEIADTPAARQRGLMFRESLPEDRGMLFDFGGETTTGFWMKDTSLPLSIAFISGEGVILDIQDMEPFSEALHQTNQRYPFAVEVNRGWFQRHGIRSGDTAQLPPR